jgi:hypothetical protein
MVAIKKSRRQTQAATGGVTYLFNQGIMLKAAQRAAFVSVILLDVYRTNYWTI